jgi:hypothetical protein
VNNLVLSSRGKELKLACKSHTLGENTLSHYHNKVPPENNPSVHLRTPHTQYSHLTLPH